MITQEIRLPVVKVEQPLGIFYACSISSELLAEISFSSRAKYKRKDIIEGVFSLVSGNQREIDDDRSKEISKYIDSIEATFPNSIILGANVDREGNLVTDRNKRWRIEEEDGRLTLVIPSMEKLATIIDGQHRLSGFKYSERKGMDLLCSVFIDLPAPYHAYIFATININQKKVNKSLAYELYGFKLENESRSIWSPEKLAVYITRKLNSIESPLKNKIKLGAEIEKLPILKGCDSTNENEMLGIVSLSTIVDGILKQISSNPKADRDALLNYKNKLGRKGLNDGTENTPLRKHYINGNDEYIETVVFDFLEALENKLWVNQSVNSYLLKTIGFQASFDLLRQYLKKNKGEFDKFEFMEVLDNLTKIDFSDVFFTASGIGVSRMKNIMLIKCGYIDVDTFSEHKDFNDYKRLSLEL
ncbi:DGQHR domain-containing protein [Vibrio cholerae]|uniref:DGQHR domain-containing protein n=1 Tax=Vibrio cholerae TaxID=666 RepID=UPI00031A83D1|nr:DGQHR domain-containing protein [Vibrio cholerae]EHB5528753.1 DGQHR domain-containing protein [Vibrio cholerae]EJL6502336.1 DGQHR domain-containing protein [Vibrio cholerae]ELQ6311795.1 DGQHR domain-containing protein [Vibrio cholerae]KNH57391.1 DGQHR domain-containing protein [Vibrio cholerae 1587]MVB47363.1 DGQHR domain-containing protein [Vibrio cholerae]